jgi:hypothetical protein
MSKKRNRAFWVMKSGDTIYAWIVAGIGGAMALASVTRLLGIW